jgi:hypothetical protein
MCVYIYICQIFLCPVKGSHYNIVGIVTSGRTSESSFAFRQEQDI